MGLWTELSSVATTSPAELFEQDSHSPSSSAPHNQRMDFCCLRLVSHHSSSHRKQHDSLKSKNEDCTAHTVSSTVSLTLWWVASENNPSVSSDLLSVVGQEQQGCQTHISGGCRTLPVDHYINNSHWIVPWYWDQETGVSFIKKGQSYKLL